MDKRKIMRVVVTTATCAAIMLPLLAFALPVVTTSDVNPITAGSIRDLIKSIATWLLGIAMVVAVIIIVIGGLQWILSRGDEKKVTAAKAVVMNAIYGALVILAIGLILSTIEKLVSTNVNTFN